MIQQERFREIFQSLRAAHVLRHSGINLSEVGRFTARDLLMKNDIGRKTLADITRACIFAAVDSLIRHGA